MTTCQNCNCQRFAHAGVVPRVQCAVHKWCHNYRAPGDLDDVVATLQDLLPENPLIHQSRAGIATYDYPEIDIYYERDPSDGLWKWSVEFIPLDGPTLGETHADLKTALYNIVQRAETGKEV